MIRNISTIDGNSRLIVNKYGDWRKKTNFLLGGDRTGGKGVCGRFMSPARETQSMWEIRLLHGRLPCKGGGLTGIWLCKRIWVCTLCGAPQVGPNSSQTSYLLQNLYYGTCTCYWHSGPLSVEFFQFEVFAVVCVCSKCCYNIPISVGLKLWMHVLWWLVNVLLNFF